jgi:hypothetical protein
MPPLTQLMGRAPTHILLRSGPVKTKYVYMVILLIFIIVQNPYTVFSRKTVPYCTVKGFEMAVYGMGGGSADAVILPSICTADTVYGYGAHPYL